ncbi:MAG: hypothetical protein WCP79_13205 [Bacillota bacterium]
MNIDIIKIIQLLFHLVEDTELKDNKTFQIAKEVVSSVGISPLAAGCQPLVAIHQPPAANCQPPISANCQPPISADRKPPVQL